MEYKPSPKQIRAVKSARFLQQYCCQTECHQCVFHDSLLDCLLQHEPYDWNLRHALELLDFKEAIHQISIDEYIKSEEQSNA